MCITHRKLALAIAVSLASMAGSASAAEQPAGVSPVQEVRVKAVAHFDFDARAVKPEDQPKLLAEVASLKDVTWQNVHVIGHTDSIGPARYNKALSKRRALAVKSYLVGQGLDSQTVDTAGMGFAEPMASNGTAAGRSQNRRAEVEFRGVRVTQAAAPAPAPATTAATKP